MGPGDWKKCVVFCSSVLSKPPNGGNNFCLFASSDLRNTGIFCKSYIHLTSFGSILSK